MIQHRTEEQLIVIELGACRGELLHLVSRLSRLENRGRELPAADVARVAELREKMARLKLGHRDNKPLVERPLTGKIEVGS